MSDGKKLTKVLEDLSVEDREAKGPVSLYLTNSEFEKFKKNCGEIAPSKVVDHLIRLFNKEKETA